jgi:putative component of membrane protein insertase Oxa1/YidC/SpoIIIJ protein YidD
VGRGRPETVLKNVLAWGIGFASRSTHALTGQGPCCRFFPSCSQYVQTAFLQFGFFRAFFLSFSRVARCNPWGGSGFDPLPNR